MILLKKEVPVLQNRILGFPCWNQGYLVMSNPNMNYISHSIYKRLQLVS